MRVVTVNLPESHLTAISRLCGQNEDDVYPSRSEFVRVAVKNQLLQDFTLQKILDEPSSIDVKTLEGSRTKSYKIIKKLPIEEEKVEMRITKLMELRKQYPEIVDYKFIGEA